ncbi:MAG: hypothetical protein JXB23_13120 [Candidatus Aminicenantes bacterium]|nr:hypothetical protein [Candidatus Aminicenantes bacterium]
MDHYIFPERAIKMDAHLKAQLEQGKYDAIKEVRAFAGILTQDLRSFSEDKHIRVNFDLHQLLARPLSIVKSGSSSVIKSISFCLKTSQ